MILRVFSSLKDAVIQVLGTALQLGSPIPGSPAFISEISVKPFKL